MLLLHLWNISFSIGFHSPAATILNLYKEREIIVFPHKQEMEDGILQFTNTMYVHGMELWEKCKHMSVPVRPSPYYLLYIVRVRGHIIEIMKLTGILNSSCTENMTKQLKDQ